MNKDIYVMDFGLHMLTAYDSLVVSMKLQELLSLMLLDQWVLEHVFQLA
jgi:hypothetical protein